MADYSKTTNFTAKDALPIGNPSKTILGSEHDTEYSNIETAIATKANKTGAPATTNNLAMLSATGDLADSLIETDGSGNISSNGSATFSTLTLGGTLITSSATELNYNDITTLGTVEASKTVTADASKNISGINVLKLQSALPILELKETDATADEQIWRFRASGDQLAFYTLNDAETVGVSWLTLTRTGTTPGSATFPYGITANLTGDVTVGSQTHVGIYSGAVQGGSGTFYYNPSGWTVSNTVAGEYTITHNLGDSAFTNTAISVTAINSVAGRVCVVSNITTNTFVVHVRDDAGTKTNSSFAFIMNKV